MIDAMGGSDRECSPHRACSSMAEQRPFKPFVESLSLSTLIMFCVLKSQNITSKAIAFDVYFSKDFF
jgi:hypothetical protein